MKKVCHVVSGLYRYDSRIFLRQCRSLAKAGYEVSILINDGSQEEICDNVRIVPCDYFIESRLKVLISAKSQFLKNALEINADIYQLHGPELIPLGLKLKKLNKRIVYDAHEDLPRDILEKQWIPNIFRVPISVFSEIYLKRTLSKFDEIITVTPHIVDNLKKISESVSLITNFPIIKDAADFSLEQYKGRKNVMCYSGTVYHYSNQEFILEALSSLNNVEYWIAGQMDDAYHQKLSTHSGYKKVKYLGRIQPQELIEFYSSAVLGLVVYDYKQNLGFKIGSYGTNKIFEYMEAGLPIICTDFELWKGIIDKYDCGIYVQPNNAQQIQNAVSYIINNKERAYEMGRNGRKAVIKEFNWAVQEKKYVSLFAKYAD